MDGGRGILPASYLIRATESRSTRLSSPTRRTLGLRLPVLAHAQRLRHVRHGRAAGRLPARKADYPLHDRRHAAGALRSTAHLRPFYEEDCAGERYRKRRRAEAELAQALSALAWRRCPTCPRTRPPSHRFIVWNPTTWACAPSASGKAATCRLRGTTAKRTVRLGRRPRQTGRVSGRAVPGIRRLLRAWGASGTRHLTGDAPCGMEMLLGRGRGQRSRCAYGIRPTR
jgi:hypothetical protein